MVLRYNAMRSSVPVNRVSQGAVHCLIFHQERWCPLPFLPFSPAFSALHLRGVLLLVRARKSVRGFSFEAQNKCWLQAGWDLCVSVWRRMIQTTLSSLTRWAFFVMGFQVKVKGKAASQAEAPIFVAAPHSSFFDAIICALTGMPSIVSRAENLSTPVFGSKYLWKKNLKGTSQQLDKFYLKNFIS